MIDEEWEIKKEKFRLLQEERKKKNPPGPGHVSMGERWHSDPLLKHARIITGNSNDK